MQEDDLNPVAVVCELINDNVIPKSIEETKKEKMVRSNAKWVQFIKWKRRLQTCEQIGNQTSC